MIRRLLAKSWGLRDNSDEIGVEPLMSLFRRTIEEVAMSAEITPNTPPGGINEKYAIPAAPARPHIKASVKLDLNGPEGRQIVKSETKLVLRTHAVTFQRLADM